MNIIASVYWRGDVLFITDDDKVWRVWIGADDQPLMEQVVPGIGDFAWPGAHLRGVKRGQERPYEAGLDQSHRDQGSNFNPRGWGRS